MFDRYIQQLSSQDVETRRLAIIALGNSADQRAMAALANVYKNDPDPALRELALKAGRYIKRTTDSMQAVQPGQVVQAAAQQPAAAAPPVVPSQPVQSPKRTTGSMQAVQTGQVAQSPLPKVNPFDLSKPFTADPTDPMAFQIGVSTPPAAVEAQQPAPTVPSSTAIVPAAPMTITPLPKIAPLPGSIPTPEAPRKITQREKQLAKGKLDSAIGMMTHGELDRAIGELVEAVQINPALAKDTLAMNLATRVTGINSPEEAMQTIVQRAKHASANKAKENPKNIKFVLDADARQMLIMIGVLALVMAGVGLTYKYTMLSLFEAVGRLGRTRPTTELALAELQRVTIGDTLKFGALFTFDALFDTVTLYAIGTWLGGSGLVFQFIRVILRVQVIMYFAVAIGMGLLALGFKATNASPGGGSALIPFGAAVVGLSLVIGFIWKMIEVGRQHEVGFVKGFMITLAGTVLSYFAIGIIPLG